MKTRREMLEPWVNKGHTTHVQYFLPDNIHAKALEELNDYHPGAKPEFKVLTKLDDETDPNTSLAVEVEGAWSPKSKLVMESMKFIPAAPQSKRPILIALPGHSDGGGVWWELCHIRLQAMPQELTQKINQISGFDSIGNELVLIWRPKEEKRGDPADDKIPDEYYYTCWKW
ncbi:MAG: hypothetical protein MRY76_00415 [Pseudomonadales bacterium]|nr:hypothetical protein [Pseudomonadales bacterium]